MVVEKVNFKEAVNILKSLKYSDHYINCIKTDDELRKIMWEKGYREGYGCWVAKDDINPDLDMA